MKKFIYIIMLFVMGCSWGCTHKVELEVKIKDINKLLDGGFIIHVDGIPDGGVPVSVVYKIPTLQKFLEKDDG